MMTFTRVAVAVVLTASVWAGTAACQDKTSLAGDRDKVSYAIGMDVGHAIAPVAPDMDVHAFEQAVGDAVAGKKPAMTKEAAIATDTALRARVSARNGKTPPGSAPGTLPPIDRKKVGQLVGGMMIGPSLAPIKDELELPTLLQAIRTSLSGGAALLSDGEAKSTMAGFTQRMQAKMQAKAMLAGDKNRSEGDAFLARNKVVKGVYTTPSGLQYTVLRQGTGPLPKPGDHVRVNYRGTLLDGTVFDSSYDRGEPAEFGLDQVIAGWSEGVTMMPVGAKYRFWIPSGLAYGAKGIPGGPVGPNATLVFDVELMSIL